MYRVGIAAVAVFISGCTVSGHDPLLAVGMPNPASVYCIERGGTLDIQQRQEGEVTYCMLSDGTRIEEWEFYRKNHPER